jgi:UDP-glucose 4-epimerase
VQAASIGRRVPVPVIGPSWAVARVVAEFFGAPLPAHVQELLVRGRTADGALAAKILGVTPETSTPDVVKDLYEWASVTYLRPAA